MKNSQSGLKLALALGCLMAATTLFADEVQRHGLVFEEWIRNTFFEGYKPGYTDKWDIAAAANKEHGGIPVNPKATKYGTAVDMGDALRQFAVKEPFLLIIGYWQQEREMKRFVNIAVIRVEPDQWQRLWQPITREDLERLDRVIKNPELDYLEARRQAQAIKTASPFKDAIFVVNPKIDAHGQRRLQCSLRFDDVFKHLASGADSKPHEQPQLWGIAVPDPIPSEPRRFRSE